MQWDVRFDLRVDLTDQDLLRFIYEAAAIAKITQQIPLKPEIRRSLNRLNIIRAVRGTTGIEGSDLTEEEVGKVLASTAIAPILPASRLRQELETRNAARVMEYVASTLDDDPAKPLTEALIAELHNLTTVDIPYENNTPGEYRHHGVTVLEYRPPRHYEEVRRLMTEFVAWANSNQALSWHPIVRAVAAHFYLISIHPFGDGNGRTARAVESFLLYQGEMNQLGFYSLANFYYRERDRYIDLLDYTRFQSGGDLTEFVRFAAQGLLAEMEFIKDEVLARNREVAFYDYAEEHLVGLPRIKTPTRTRAMAILDFLHALGHIHVAAIRSETGPLAALYRDRGGSRAAERDLRLLRSERLIVIDDDGVIVPNLDIMDQYTRPVFDRGRLLA